MTNTKLIQLTEHFTLEEFTRSAIAALRGIDNKPDAVQLTNLQMIAHQMEHVRYLLGGNPIIISSGFRSEALNDVVGGSSTSSHAHGLAVDFTCPKFGTVKEVCMHLKNNSFKFDQLIYEQGRTNWCHLGFGEKKRQEVLSWKSGKGYVFGIIDL